MKPSILVSLIAFTIPSFAFGQAVKYKEIQNADLRYVLNNILKTTSYDDDKNSLYVNVYNVGDPSGSANNESCEITNSIYIAVSEDGELPEQHLFRLTSIYGAKFVTWTKTSVGPALVMTYGPNNKRKKVTILVGLKRLTLK
jgi:hypothetical protein